MRRLEHWLLPSLRLVLSCTSWIVIGAVAAHASTAPADETLKIADIVAIARQNARLPKTLRVTWRVERGPTEAARHFRARLAGQLTSAIKANAVPKEQLDKVLSDTAELEKNVKFAKREYADFDYWTDFQSFQHRALRHPATGAPFGFTEPTQIPFPDRLPNHLEVTELFSDIAILSYGPATNRTFRLWQASINKPRFGLVGVESPWFKEWHPPLIMPNGWGGKLHPIDDFFALLQSRGGTVLGTVDYSGRPHVSVFSTDGSRTLRAFIDLEQGAIPSRIEEFPWQVNIDELTGSGISDLDPKLIARFITTCEIHSTDCAQGRYYYPASGQFQMMSMAASPSDAISPAQPEVAAHESTTWKYRQVECDREMAPEDFRLAFPPGMVFVDQTAKASFMTGDAEGNMQRIADGAINFGRKTSPLRWIVGSTCIVGVLVCVGYFTRTRWRRRIA